jgi:hypothetical protein
MKRLHTQEERAALIRCANVLESQVKNLRYMGEAHLSDDADNAIVSHVRQACVDALESLSDDWGFDSIAVCCAPESEDA